jgi:hypothetical protein
MAIFCDLVIHGTMMNIKRIFLLFIALGSLQGFCQNTIPVTLKDSCTWNGVIFPAEYRLPFAIEAGSKRITPSTDQVDKAEMLLLNNSGHVKYKGLVGIYEPRKLKRKLSGYNRQYVGYLNQASDTVILVHLLNFNNMKKAKESFYGWQNSYVIGFGKYYETNMVTIMVNLTKKEVASF